MRAGGRRGAVLIVVLAVLLILALLATVFVTLTSLEKSIARNYVDDVRARLLAQSGVDDGIARLREILPRGFFDASNPDESWLYFGNILDETQAPNPGTPLEAAVNPSFAVEADGDPTSGSAAPRTLVVEGKTVGYSGRPDTGRYGLGGDQYVLRVTDANSQINVNDGVPWGPGHSVSRNLRRILNVLGAQPTVNVPGLGDLLLSKRPASGYTSKYEILGALGYDQAAFNRVAGFLTTHSWTDPNVANPVPLSSQAADPAVGAYQINYDRPSGVYRYGHNRNYTGAAMTAPLLFYTPGNPNPYHHAIWGFDSLHPQWIEIVARSPVNLNTARREVLVALLVDLEGVFVVERRRDTPYTPPSSGFGWSGQTGGYAWLGQMLTYDGAGNEGDECGFLYRTIPFVGPGGQSASGIDATLVVDEILACRERKPSPHLGFDYASVPFGGPFRSWAQFNAFVDNLVKEGMIADNRPNLFHDVDGNGNVLSNSPAQRRIASQAAADVLKANFNPNLNLNELNPDRVLFTHVDKTDLIVASTEFCFTPMGTFEIESLGRVLAPKSGQDCFAAADNQIVAEKKVLAVVRLFDAVRETTQAQFYQAYPFSNRTTWPETNNNRGIETGPEPDNGPQPEECTWSGYVALPTLGGNLGNSFEWGQYKAKGQLKTTYPTAGQFPGCATYINGGAQFSSTIHAHFQVDAVAHHHLDKVNYPGGGDMFKLPLGAWWMVYGGRASVAMNWEDKTEPILSPYTPVDSGWVTGNGPNRYRLGRAFTLPKVGSTGAAPAAYLYSPSDLRLDGIYAERGSAIGYWITQGSSFDFREGTACFWVKPNFHPECTGKPRTFLSMGRYHEYGNATVNPSPFGLFFFPAHDAAAGAPSSYENPSIPSYYGGIGKLRPASLGFGIGMHPATGYNWELGGSDASLHANVVTPTLNHENHGTDNGSRLTGDDGKPNLLRAHEWTHIAVTWRFQPGTLHDADSVQIFVNGQIQPGTVGIPSFYGATAGEPNTDVSPWYLHSMQVSLPGWGTFWATNQIRIGGEISKLFGGAWGGPSGGQIPRNFTADATFDEFYLWTNRATTTGGGLLGAQTLWYRGRYYKPSDANAADGVFLSQPLALGPPARSVPPSTTISAPDGTATPTGNALPPPSKRRVIGVAWTAYAEEYDSNCACTAGIPCGMRPRMLDYSSWPPTVLAPAAAADANGHSAESVADFWMVIDGVTYGPYRNEMFSAVKDAAGGPVEVTSSVQYRTKLKIGPKTPSTILLATPVLEDVTVFFDCGTPEIVGWLSVNISR